MTRRSLVWICSCLAAAGAPAQTRQPPAFTDVVHVNVVNLSVQVTDREGNPVEDLSLRDFELREDGKRVKITNFDFIRRQPGAVGLPASGAGETALPLPEEDDRRQFVAIYIDDRHLRPQHRNRIFGQLREFLENRRRFDDRVLVVRYHHGLTIEQPFTRDPALVEGALARVLDRPSGARRPLDERRLVIRDLQAIQQANQERFGGAGCGDQDRMVARVESYAAEAQAEAEASLRALGEFATSLGGLPGRKSVLFVSDGMPLQAGEDLFWLVDELCPSGAGGGPIPSTAALIRPGHFAIADLLDAMTRQANRNNVTIYSLQAAGLPLPAASETTADARLSTSPRLDFLRRANLQDPLSGLATATGGVAFLDTNDVRASLERLERDLGSYYSLGYVPRRRADTRDHRIEVRVRRKGVRVRHRQTHRDSSRLDQIANRTLAALWFEHDYNPMEVGVQLDVAALQDGKLLLPILVKIPLHSLQLLGADDGFRGQVSVFVAHEEASGRKPPARRALVPVRVSPEEYLGAPEQPVLYGFKLLLEPGTRQLAFGVFDHVGGRYSVLRQPLDGIERAAGTASRERDGR